VNCRMDVARRLAGRPCNRARAAAGLRRYNGVPTVYHGDLFRSKLEAAGRARSTISASNGNTKQHAYRLPSGTRYLPDFWLPALRTFIEVKGPAGPGQA